MSLSTISSSLEEISPEQEWRQKWNAVKKLADDLLEEAEKLMRKGRIRYGEKVPGVLIWQFNIIPEIFEKRLDTTRDILGKCDAIHALIGSTTHYNSKKTFDLPGDTIQKCAEQLLSELRAANASSETSLIEL